jgi:hypothetical protein
LAIAYAYHRTRRKVFALDTPLKRHRDLVAFGNTCQADLGVRVLARGFQPHLARQLRRCHRNMCRDTVYRWITVGHSETPMFHQTRPSFVPQAIVVTLKKTLNHPKWYSKDPLRFAVGWVRGGLYPIKMIASNGAEYAERDSQTDV